MKTPTIEQFTAWAKAHNQLAKAVCAAQALSECERVRVDAYILPLFRSFKFDGIGEPDLLYRCDDDAKCAQYFAACDVAHREHGFTGPAEHCPALIAREIYIDAQNALLRSGCDLTGLRDIPSLPDQRAAMLDILLTACLKKAA